MPDDQNFAEDKDRAIYERELLRLKMSLDSAKKKQQSGSRIIVMMHFPPLYPNRRKTGFSEIISEYGVNSVVYGHLHGDCYSQARYPVIEENGIPYYLVSCDTLDFRLREII